MATEINPAEVDPMTASKLEDLPTRILGKILSFVPTNDHAVLKDVSPIWEKLIDEHIGVPVYIGRPSDYNKDRFNFSPVEQIGKMGISILYLTNIHNTVFPKFKYPNLVKQISFIDYISTRNFVQALSQLTNLRHLTINMSTCHYLEFQNISLDFLTRLETLSFCAGEYCSEWNEEVHPSKNEAQITIDNLFGLLTHNYFRNLKELLIGFPIISPLNGNVTFVTSLFKCILHHHETLRHIQMYFDGKLEASLVNSNLAVTVVDIDYDSLASVQLHHIFVNLHEFHQTHNLVEPWLRLLNVQKNLKRCIFIPPGGDEDECVELPLPQELLVQSPCSTTLTIFKWFVEEAEGGDPGNSIDCTLFQQCLNLVEINLTASGNNPSHLINVSRLPISLQKVCFEGIHCRTDDIESLATDFPSLQNLSLTTVGEFENFGMNVETLRTIYERKTLSTLLILDGFNKQSVRSTTSQEQSSFSFLIMLLKTKFYDGDSYFHMKLCENGEYAMMQ